MNKVFYLLFVLISFNSYGQLGINGGFGLSKYRFTENGKDNPREREFSYQFGVVYRLGVANLFLQPSLNYSPIITRNNYPSNSNILYYQNRLNYLQLDLPAFIRFGYVGYRLFEAGVGGYYSRLLSGISRSKDLYDVKTTSKFKIGNSNTDDFKPGDAGISFHFGIGYQKIHCYLVDFIGFSNNSPVSGQKIVNRNFEGSIVFLFSNPPADKKHVEK